MISSTSSMRSVSNAEIDARERKMTQQKKMKCEEKESNVSKGKMRIKIDLTNEEEQLILEQMKYIQSEVISIQQGFLGVISIPMGIYAVIIYYTLTVEDSDIRGLLFLVLPFFFSLSFYNILKYTIKILGLEAYQCYLEKILNENHQKPLFLWQNLLVYANGYSVLGAVGQVPCCAFIFIFLFYKFFTLGIKTEALPEPFRVCAIVLLMIQVLFLMIMLLHCGRQYFVIEDICEKELREYSAQSETWLDYKSMKTELPEYVKAIIKK